MSKYKAAIRLNGELVYINGMFFYQDKGIIGNLMKYDKFLEEKLLQNMNFRKGNVKGASFEFNDPERINMVLFIPVPSLRGHNYLPASAHALSEEISAQMLKEFSDITGFVETDVSEPIVDFYKSIEEMAVRLPRDNPKVMI